MSEITLTLNQIKQIKKDMEEKTEMLSDAEITALANKVNAHVNLPFLNEDKEAYRFRQSSPNGWINNFTNFYQTNTTN